MWFLPELIAYLNGVLDVPVSSTVPEKRPVSAVTVVQLGGQGNRFTETIGVIVHAWGRSDIEAMELIGEVAEAILYFPDHSANVGHVSQENISSNPYEEGVPRWSGTFSFVINR